MKYTVSYGFKEETIEAKTRWFVNKPIEVRLQEAFSDITFAQKLRQFELPDDRSTFKTVRFLKLPKS